MNIAVIGTGMVGQQIAFELAKRHNIYAFDFNIDNLGKLNEKNSAIITKKVDINKVNLTDELNSADLAINCLPGFMGFKTCKKIIKEKMCIDISFMPEDCQDLDSIAREANTALYPDAGIAPGLSNMIIGNIVSKNNIDEIKIMVGGLPIKKNPPWNYKAPFSPIDVIEEYTRSARIKKEGKIKSVKALTGLINFEFEGIGKLEAFLTDGLRTLLNAELTRDIPTLLEYTIRYPGHSEMISKLIEEGKLDDNLKFYNGKMTTQREMTTNKLFKEWKLMEDDKEFTLLIITAKTKEGEKISCVVYDEWREGWSSMSRTTGLTACAITNLIIDKKISKTGVITPETLGTNNDYFEYVVNYLKERHINIHFSNLKNFSTKE